MVYIVYTIQKYGAFMSKSSPVKAATAPAGANGSVTALTVSDVTVPAKKTAAKPAAAPKAAVAKVKTAAAKPVVEKAPSKPAASKASAEKPAAKAAAPAVKAAAKPAAKPAAKAAPKAAAKPAAKSASKVAAVKTVAKPAEKTADAKHKDSDKLVRDSFTMPEQEYAVLGQVKKSCLKAGFEIKKSELLRIGVALISQIDLATLQNVLAALPQLKTGRPKKG